jgi:hypothetical protein
MIEAAIRANDVQAVRRACREGGVDLDARLPGGETPLTLAVEVAGVPVIRALLAAFANPKATNAAGEDALERAVKLGRKNVAYVLERRTAPTRDEGEHPAVRLKRAMEHAREQGPEAIELVAAAYAGDLGTVRRLLREGVDPDVMDPNRPGKETSLDLAILKGHIEVIAALAEAGADLDAEPIGCDRAIFLAIGWNKLDVLAALAEGGADLRRPNKNGLTPLEFARKNQNAAAQAELMRLGADPVRGADEAPPIPPPLEPYAFEPQTGGLFDAPPADHFGLPTADVISCGLLVETDVGAVASALFELIDADVHHHDAVGREVARNDTAYVVWRLAGHTWAAVTQLDFSSGVLTAAHAGALAMRLKARSIFVRICDTAGSGEYALFDTGGRVAEVFEMSDDGPTGMGIDLSPLAARMSSDGPISFGSRLRDSSAGDIDDPWKFFGQFFEEQRALAPSAWDPEQCFEEGSRPGMLTLVVPTDNFGYDAQFERIDYVAVGA